MSPLKAHRLKSLLIIGAMGALIDTITPRVSFDGSRRHLLFLEMGGFLSQMISQKLISALNPLLCSLL